MPEREHRRWFLRPPRLGERTHESKPEAPGTHVAHKMDELPGPTAAVDDPAPRRRGDCHGWHCSDGVGCGQRRAERVQLDHSADAEHHKHFGIVRAWRYDGSVGGRRRRRREHRDARCLRAQRPEGRRPVALHRRHDHGHDGRRADPLQLFRFRRSCQVQRRPSVRRRRQ